MKKLELKVLAITMVLAGLSTPSMAFNSGSTGADGPFSPAVNTELQLPESGVFNFTTVNIPAGVTVKFKKNTTNTPLVILTTGDVTIGGTLDLNGTASAAVGAAGDGNIGDDGVPGVGGPGGYDGGRGGDAGKKRSGPGLGVGGGGPSAVVNHWSSNGDVTGGGGGGFGVAGTTADPTNNTGNTAVGGPAYGSSVLLPLLGGSGGGGGGGGQAFKGSGGGGGGGAILIASSGTVTLAGTLRANGGGSGATAGDGRGATGGGGSGGGIRIVATAIAGNGSVTATGGVAGSAWGYTGSPGYYTTDGGAGAVGRIRFESDSFTRTAASNPAHSFAAPGALFVAGLPTLRIVSVAGVNSPANPTGNADITLPSTTPNPVTVLFATTGVPAGNTVRLRVTPTSGDKTEVVSPAITGDTVAGSANVAVNLPSGASVLSATTTYTIVVAMGEALSKYAQGERVEKVRLSTTMNGPTLVTLITVSGKEYDVPHSVLAAMPS